MDQVLNFFNLYFSRKMLILLGMGFSSGLPLALITGTLQAWLRSDGTNLGIIGMFSLVGIPYTLKMLWAPFMDRFPIPFLSRRRGWIFVCQVILCITLCCLGALNPDEHLEYIALLSFMVAFFSASQDIVIDAYRTEILEDEEKGAGAAISVFGYRVAMITSGALALILSDYVSWFIVYCSMGALLLASSIFIFFALPVPGEFEKPKNIKEAMVDPFISYFKRKGAIEMLLFIVLFKLGDVIAGSMTTPFLIDLGFTRSTIGAVNKGFGLVSTIIGTFIGGAFISRLGLNKSLWIFAILQALSNFSFSVLAMIGKSHLGLTLTIAFENLAGGMGTAAFVAFLMSLCDKKFTATQYALLSSLMALTRTVAGAFTGYMAQSTGWAWFFALSVLGAIPGLLLLPRFAPWNKKTLT